MTGRIVTQALIWGLLGAIVAPIALVMAFGMIASLFGACGGPGDSGGCAMGLFSLLLVLVPIGGIAGIVFGIVIGRRPIRPRPTT